MLMHVSGDLAGPVPVDTPLGGPAVPGDTTRLTRVVEMYQWKEERRSETRYKVGGGTETVTRYTYSAEWSAQQIDSGRFAEPSERQNPPMHVRGDSFAVDRVLDVGDRRWTVPAAYVSRIGEERALWTRGSSCPFGTLVRCRADVGEVEIQPIDQRIGLHEGGQALAIGDDNPRAVYLYPVGLQ